MTHSVNLYAAFLHHTAMGGVRAQADVPQGTGGAPKLPAGQLHHLTQNQAGQLHHLTQNQAGQLHHLTQDLGCVEGAPRLSLTASVVPLAEFMQ
ncbi:unnamed protein product [Boreogadus saida]